MAKLVNCKGCGKDTRNVGGLCGECRWQERPSERQRDPSPTGWHNGVPIGSSLEPNGYDRTRDDDIDDEVIDSLDLD